MTDTTTAGQQLIDALKQAGHEVDTEAWPGSGCHVVTVSLGNAAQIWVSDHDCDIRHQPTAHRGWLACYYPDIEDTWNFKELFGSDSTDFEADTAAVVSAITDFAKARARASDRS
ncbi:hypothetical protein [Streptomyces olivoreticuli]|uniref:hypothetical protein n=1 Tax=Streptomyces olivoreticuli TaxID=68246 RepID=UPI000E2402BF|nr:hypothetical protein [Streptomyces olivoreticuli]